MKKLTICLIFLIVISLVLGITYFSIIGFNQKDRLIREISIISKMDVNENISLNTKTTGQYKIIEKDLKQYFKDMKENINTVLEVTQDSKYSTILKVDNLKYDGPNFEKSFSFLDEAYNKMDKCSEYIKNNLSKSDFEKRAEALNLEKEYYDLYMELVTEYILSTEENTKKGQIEVSINGFKDIVNYQKKVLTYLKANKEGWGTHDDKLVFYDAGTMVGYTTVINSYNSDIMSDVIIPDIKEAE